MKKTMMSIFNALALGCLFAALYVSYIVENLKTEAMFLWGYVLTHSLAELIRHSMKDEW